MRVEEIRAAPALPVVKVRSLEEVEKAYILWALALNGGNQTCTARQLQIGAATLYRKLKGYGLIAGKPAVHRKAGKETGRQ